MEKINIADRNPSKKGDDAVDDYLELFSFVCRYEHMFCASCGVNIGDWDRFLEVLHNQRILKLFVLISNFCLDKQ